MSNTPLTLTSGLPFGKIVLVTLPTGRSWWNALEDFEVRAEVRSQDSPESTLLLDFGPYITVTMDDADTVRIVFEMSGEQTRGVKKSGFYDVIMSDPGATDARAKKVLKGDLSVDTVITAPEPVTP